MYGVTADKWGTVTRMVDTGTMEPITLDIPDLEPGQEYTPQTRPGKLVYVRWDGDTDEWPEPYLQFQLEAESAIERLGGLLEEE